MSQATKKMHKLAHLYLCYPIWLERMVVAQTLPGVEDEQELQQTIQEVRALIDGLSILKETE